MDKLTRTEAVDVDLGKLRLHVVQQVEIPLLRQPRMVAALQQQLRAALGDGFLDLPVHLRVADDVGLGVPFGAVERAEFAIDVADIRVVDVAVHDVRHNVIAASGVRAGLGALPPPVGQGAEFLQRQPVQTQRLGGVNASAIPNLVPQVVQ
ncbi:MAG: hypothetical protein BWX84_01978 [Verrucomicrobia bacterium ADurb.Bin118]|nr:MAG: hypothetical protein BWX84_01978 [Verrucomicrobia bacterium ADurb.Bin118]